MFKFLSYFAAFYLGRLSFMVWKNMYLEEKREALHQNAIDILEYGEDLRKREEIVNKKYKEMLNLAAEVRVAAEGETSEWDGFDDELMRLWINADN